MNAPRSKLRNAMKSQKITFKDLQGKLGHSRQMISRAADAYVNGERIPEDIEREFNRILANQSAENFPGGELCSKELILGKIAECEAQNAKALEELEALMDLSDSDISQLKDMHNSKPEMMRSQLGEDDDSSHWWRTKTTLDRMGALRKEHVALEIALAEADDVDTLDALWESTFTVNKRPILYHEGYSTSFCTVSGSKAMVYARYYQMMFDIDLTINAYVELFVLTESEIFPIRSIKASDAIPGYPGLVAEFEIIPDFKYFYRIRYEGISAKTMGEKYLAEMGQEEYDSLPQAIKNHMNEPSMVEIPGEYTKFHPLK